LAIQHKNQIILIWQFSFSSPPHPPKLPKITSFFNFQFSIYLLASKKKELKIGKKVPSSPAFEKIIVIIRFLKQVAKIFLKFLNLVVLS
jgi:hypothetical protein